MSVYAIHKLLWLTEEDPGFRLRLQNDPDETLKEFSLTSEESQALRAGDVGTLYQMGVTSFMMRLIPTHGLFGVTPQSYREFIGQQDPLRNVGRRDSSMFPSTVIPSRMRKISLECSETLRVAQGDMGKHLGPLRAGDLLVDDVGAVAGVGAYLACPSA